MYKMYKAYEMYSVEKCRVYRTKCVVEYSSDSTHSLFICRIKLQTKAQKLPKVPGVNGDTER